MDNQPNESEVANQAEPHAAPAATGATELTAANPTLTSTTPTVAITVPNTSGTVTFQLIVTDNLGTRSAPVTVTVEIQSPPTAKIEATPTVVAPGQTITLSGTGSTAVAPGTIASYTFTVENPAAPVT
jgi:hypothetical protein